MLINSKSKRVDGGEMREIKFRAWDILVEYITYDQVFIYQQMFKYGKVRGHTLMQYTGLKDSNNVDIYEGDILDFIETGGVLRVVKWRDDEAGFNVFKTYMPDQFRIIGNIHENPELMEGI